VSKEKAAYEIPIIARFINSCDAGQIRLASYKCNLLTLNESLSCLNVFSFLFSLGRWMMLLY